jgi:hypothetical protein
LENLSLDPLRNISALSRANIVTTYSRRFSTTLCVLLLLACTGKAQCTTGSASSTGSSNCAQSAPHFVKFNGKLPDVVARNGVAPVEFTIYADPTGGTALWQEIQVVHPDFQGHYDVVLGITSTSGIPSDLFTSADSRWLGVRFLEPGSLEEPRVLLVSVPYAVEASNAETLGGLPASAFAKVSPSTSTSTSTSSEIALNNNSAVASTSSPAVVIQDQSLGVSGSTSSSTPAIEGRSGPVNVIPKYSGGGFASSQITDASGVVTMQNLSNILFADRFSGGVPDAVAACPANGCIIYALSPNVNLSLGTIDPGTKAITIYLGPYTYTVKQIILRKALKIIGMGASGGTNGSVTCSVSNPCNGTMLQSVNGNNPVFVVPQTNNTPVTNLYLSGFRVIGSSGNTSEDGFFLDTSSTVNSGLWYSTIDDVLLEGFAGIPIHVKGPSANFVSLTQWVLFNQVVAFRTPGGGNALRLEGATFELRFRNCEFDGLAQGDGTDIYMGGTGHGVNGYPVSVVFEGLIAQSAGTAVQLDGGYNLAFYGSHHELLLDGYHITNNTGIGVHGLTITDSYFAGNTTNNGGAGYAMKIDDTINEGIVFSHNQMFGNPDATVISTNLASVVYQDNLYAGTANNPPTSGITTQLSPATSINVRGVHSVGLNPSTTPITTIQSTLGPGEMITFYPLSGEVTFASGGNINLAPSTSVNVTGSITFMLSDLGGPSWIPVSQWTPPGPSARPTPGVAARSDKRNNHLGDQHR